MPYEVVRHTAVRGPAAVQVTYPLHIILRYELERGLVDGSVAVEDIPRLWNEKMQQYLGATPPNDAKGCLQVRLCGRAVAGTR